MESKAEPRSRGTGSIFHNGSAVFWIKYYCRGIPHRESSHSTNRQDAEKLLKRRLAEVMTETFIPKRNVRIDELIRDVESDYRANGRKSLKHVQMRWKHLAPVFSRMRAADVTTDHIRRYITARQEAGAASGTINRDLALLKRAFNLATQCTPPKLRVIPFIPMPKEGPPRKGFLAALHPK